MLHVVDTIQSRTTFNLLERYYTGSSTDKIEEGKIATGCYQCVMRTTRSICDTSMIVRVSHPWNAESQR